jgi:uncharacterized membrane-anchored protein YhcB (DUF1043 family)
MRSKTFIGVIFLVLVSCTDKNQQAAGLDMQREKDSLDKKKFQMYEMTEMALLMEQMFVDNQRVRDKIIKGEKLGDFPGHFSKIHSAVMTDESERDLFFEQQAKLYLSAQQLIYDDPANAKEHFNKGVDACLACHEEKCAGPIPRIKKLYLN